jgi:hypothetical protein
MCRIQQAATHQHREVCIHQHITVVIKVVVVSSYHDVLLHLHDSSRQAIKHRVLGDPFHEIQQNIMSKAVVVVVSSHLDVLLPLQDSSSRQEDIAHEGVERFLVQTKERTENSLFSSGAQMCRMC